MFYDRHWWILQFYMLFWFFFFFFFFNFIDLPLLFFVIINGSAYLSKLFVSGYYPASGITCSMSAPVTGTFSVLGGPNSGLNYVTSIAFPSALVPIPDIFVEYDLSSWTGNNSILFLFYF